MLEFEELKPSFETEKAKILLIKKIQSIIESEQIPDLYLEAVYNFLIGSFWIKFTPIFPSLHEALAAII